jgi:cholesterol transport system auxiliary component
MRLVLKTQSALVLAAMLSGCSLGGLLGGGSKPPVSLVTLTPEAAEPAQIARTAAAGQAVTIATPSVSRELSAVRVPVQVTATDVQYVANLQLVDTPARLFANLVAETVRRTTNRIVLDPNQTSFDPGMLVNGELRRFGYDASNGQVVVTYDGSLSTAGGGRVETRRFTAAVPADGTAASVGPALNRAANQVATQIAAWIGNSGA